MTPAHTDVSSTYGVLLVGVTVATFLQGILTVQVYQYYEDFRDDPRRIKIFVAVLWILDLAHLMLISHTIYYQLITNWGHTPNVSHFILPFRLHLFPLAFTIFFSQSFFLCRIWIFGQRNIWIVGPVFVLSLGSFSLLLAMATLRTAGMGFRLGFVSTIAVGAITDVLIAALLCYYVRGKRSEGSRDRQVTINLVTRIIRYTVATSACTSLLILACLFSYLASPSTYIFIAFLFSSGRTYPNAVLGSLNARRKLRETLEGMEPSFAKPVRSEGIPRTIPEIPELDSTRTREWSCRTRTNMSRLGAGGDNFEPVQFPLYTYRPGWRHSLP